MSEKSTTNPIYLFSTSYTGRFGLLLFLFGCALALSAVVAFAILSFDKGFSSSDLTSLHTVSPAMLRIVQIVGSAIQFGLPAWLFALILKKRDVKYYSFRQSSSLKIWLLTVLLAFAGIGFSDLLATINEVIPISAQLREQFTSKEKMYFEQILRLVDFTHFGTFLYSLIIIAVLPAFFEELFFRGALQPVLIGWMKRPFWGILFTGIVFSLVHASFFGFLPRMFLGMALGYVFYWSKNICLSILFHFINNGVAITGFYYLSLQGKLNAETASEHLSIAGQLMSTVALIVLLMLFFKQTRD